MSCLRMRSCCCCLDTAKGSIFAAVSCIVVTLLAMFSIILGLVYWDDVSYQIEQAYKDLIAGDFIATIIKVIWWGNIFSIIVGVLYIILAILLIIGVRREQYKHMIPWISSTFMLIPFFTVSFLLQLILGIIGEKWVPVVIPAIIVLVWCGFWLYGFFCAVSHYRMLKGDIHRPVATLFKRTY